MLQVVIDTNVFVSALIAPHSTPAQILRFWQLQTFELSSCEKAIGELDEVLRRPHLVEKYAIDNRKRESLINIIRGEIIMVAGDSLKGIVQADPKDDMFVACAVEGQVKYIVSGDKHLRNLKRYQAIRIVEPAYFLKILERCHSK
jgi:uncharacterized protein